MLRISSKPFSLGEKIHKSRLSMSDNQRPAHAITIASASAKQTGTKRNEVAMSAIQTSLAALQLGSALASELPYISPIAGLLLQALTMRDEVKQCKEECKLVMRKLARIASIIISVGEMCGKHNLNEGDIPASLLAILGSLQRELDEIKRVLKECSKKKGIKGLLLRKDLLTRIKQCDGELSNVLQAFQAEMALDTRFALIAERREPGVTKGVTPNSNPVEAIPITQELNGRQGLYGIKRALEVLCEAIVRHDNFESLEQFWRHLVSYPPF